MPSSSPKSKTATVADDALDTIALVRPGVRAPTLLDLPQELWDMTFQSAHPRVHGDQIRSRIVWEHLYNGAMVLGGRRKPFPGSGASKFMICNKLIKTAARAHIGNRVYHLSHLFYFYPLRSLSLITSFVTEIVSDDSESEEIRWLRTEELPNLRNLTIKLGADMFENAYPRYVWEVGFSDEEIVHNWYFADLASLRGLKKCDVLAAEESFGSSLLKQAIWQRNVSRFEFLLQEVVFQPKTSTSMPSGGEDRPDVDSPTARACASSSTVSTPAPPALAAKDHASEEQITKHNSEIDSDCSEKSDSTVTRGLDQSKPSDLIQATSSIGKGKTPIPTRNFVLDDLDGSDHSILQALAADHDGFLREVRALRRHQTELRQAADRTKRIREEELSDDEAAPTTVTEIGESSESFDAYTENYLDLLFAPPNVGDDATEVTANVDANSSESGRTNAQTQTSDLKLVCFEDTVHPEAVLKQSGKSSVNQTSPHWLRKLFQSFCGLLGQAIVTLLLLRCLKLLRDWTEEQLFGPQPRRRYYYD